MKRRAFVTGSAGFSGRHLVANLLAKRYDVTGFDLHNGSCVGCTGFYLGDVTDPTILRTAVHEAKPDTVFHLAALTDSTLEKHGYPLSKPVECGPAQQRKSNQKMALETGDSRGTITEVCSEYGRL